MMVARPTPLFIIVPGAELSCLNPGARNESGFVHLNEIELHAFAFEPL